MPSQLRTLRDNAYGVIRKDILEAREKPTVIDLWIHLERLETYACIV